MPIHEKQRGNWMRRREFITLWRRGAGVAAHWACAAAQRNRRICVLIFSPRTTRSLRCFVTAFTHALERLGWVEEKNIRIDNRFAAGNPALFKKYAEEVVSLMPDAILAGHGRWFRRCGSRRARYQSFSYSWPIPSGWALFRASRGPAATSPDSPPRRADDRKMAPIAQGGRAGGHAGRRHLQPGHCVRSPLIHGIERRPVLRDNGNACSGSRQRVDRRNHRRPVARAGRRPFLFAGQFQHDT